MKIIKYQKNQKSSRADRPRRGIADELKVTRQLFNRLYVQEEEEYYLSQKASVSFSNLSHEALFVDY
ncbi:MAG: hypothetical protein HQL12_00550 [Candidatus Omnitrophica bacterium]|nr:hypothetical protein [Candidatus Omnitrophota bacterium]